MILVLDIGSSSIRCSIYIEDGTVFKRASRCFAVVDHKIGKLNVEVDGRSLWDLIDDCIDEVLNQTPPKPIEAVGFACLAMNLVGVDEFGKPVGSKATLTYACRDTIVSTNLVQLQNELDDESVSDIYRKTGCYMGSSSYALGQLRVGYAGPDAPFRKVKQFQSISSVAFSRWLDNCSPCPISYSEASWTGLLNYSTCCYEETVLAHLPPEAVSALPSLTDIDGLTELHQLNEAYCLRWPSLRKARFFLGIGDGACANIGSKCSTMSRIACTVGTSAAARVVVPCPIEMDKSTVEVPQGLFGYRIDKDRLLLGGALTDGGSIIEWVKGFLNLDEQRFDACLHQAGEILMSDYIDHKSKLTMVPFFSGERSTGFRSNATGALIGLERSTEPAHLVKACLESVTLRLGVIVALLKLSEDTKIVVSGKGLEENALWRQMIADCTGLEVVLDRSTTEGTSRGVFVIILGLLSRGNHKPSTVLTEEEIAIATVARPRLEGRDYWNRALDAQEKLITAITPLY